MLEGNGLIQACNQIAFRSRYLIAIFRYDCYCYFCTSKTVRNINAFCVLNRFSHVWLFATLGTVACQTPLSMGFSRQEHWSELPFPSSGDLPNPGIEAKSPALHADSLPLSHLGSPKGKSKASLGGLESPTFWSTAEHANRLCHRNGSYTWAGQHRLLFTVENNLASATAKCPNCQQ